MLNKGISIVTGTLNRKYLLPAVFANTVDADDRVELVLVDGGSADGTVDYVKSLNHPRVRLVEVGKRSSYPHFMNLGIWQASHEWVCQWNDDAMLVNPWDDVFTSLDDSSVYIFSWKVDVYPGFKNKKWVLINSISPGGKGEIVVNYGIYHKNVFRKVGMYNDAYKFYCADGDLAHRAYFFGFKVKSLKNIKVIALKGVTKYSGIPSQTEQDFQSYKKHIELYRQKILPGNLEYLT